jgi:hypothetical protein
MADRHLKWVAVPALQKAGSAVDGGGSGGDDGGMQARVSVLEAANLEIRDRLIKIETRLNALASKEDLANLRAEVHASLNVQTWRIIGAVTLLTGAVYYLAKFVH